MRKSSLLLFLLLLAAPSHAFMRKLTGKDVTKDREASNLNFQELEQRLSNKQDHRNNVDVSTVTASNVVVNGSDIMNWIAAYSLLND